MCVKVCVCLCASINLAGSGWGPMCRLKTLKYTHYFNFPVASAHTHAHARTRTIGRDVNSKLTVNSKENVNNTYKVPANKCYFAVQ